MRRHHVGSGRRPVLALDWEAAHAPVVEGFMTEATINLRKPGATTHWDEGLGRVVSVPFTPFAYHVPARIAPLTSSGPSDVVDQQVFILGYKVAVPASVAPTTAQLDEGIEIAVLTCTDPLLVGATLRVTDVVRGTHRLERVLLTDLNS